MSKTAAEQIATFTTSTFKDGEAADGAPTPEEQAAADANAAKATADAENEAEKTAEGAENGGGATDEQDGEDKPDATAKATAKTGEPDKGAEKPENGEAKSKKDGANKRIGDLTAARRTAERAAESERARADRAEAELAALKSGKAPLTGAQGDDNSGAVPPDPSKFDYGELDPKYIAALARHETAQALKAHAAKDDETRQATAADAKRQEVAEKTDKLVQAGIDLHDDFDEVVMQAAREGKWDLSATVGELLLDSEFGPHIAYDLANDPTESRRVAKLSPALQAAWFGKQEAKFEAAKPSHPAAKVPAKTPQAPPPPKTPRGGSGSNTVGADSVDFAAVEQAWRSGALH